MLTLSTAGDYILARTEANGRKVFTMLDMTKYGTKEAIVFEMYDATDAWREWTKRFQGSCALSDIRLALRDAD